MSKKKYYIYQMDTTTLTIGSLILTIIIAIPAFILYPSFFLETFSKYRAIVIIAIIFLYMALHEIIHSIGYVLYGGDFKKIVYGICLEKGVFYCLCKQNINKRNILHSLLYPLIWIGIITYIISIVFKLPLLLTLSIFNLGGCIGDIIMFLFIVKLDNNIEFSEFDDPISFGIYTDKDITKENHFGLNFIKVTDKLERNDFQKIKITRISIILFIIFLIIGIIESII